MSLKNC